MAWTSATSGRRTGISMARLVPVGVVAACPSHPVTCAACSRISARIPSPVIDSGSRPASGLGASAVRRAAYQARSARSSASFSSATCYLELDDVVVPSTPRIVAHVDTLVARYPDDVHRSVVWPSTPVIDEASGPVVYLLMSYDRAEEVPEYAAELARQHALVCFSPQ